MIGIAWLALVVYAENPSTQIQWLQSGVIAALVGALIAGAVSVYNKRTDAGLDSQRVSIERFNAHEEFYEKRFADMTAQLAAAAALEARLEADLAVKTQQIANLTATVQQLLVELGRP